MIIVNSRMSVDEIRQAYNDLKIQKAVLCDRLMSFGFGLPVDDSYYEIQDELFFIENSIKKCESILKLR